MKMVTSVDLATLPKPHAQAEAHEAPARLLLLKVPYASYQGESKV